MEYIKQIVQQALLEDTKQKSNFVTGDLTVQSIISTDPQATLTINTRQDCILCGLEFARTAFQLCDSNIAFNTTYKDSANLKAGSTIATVTGNTRALLTAERTALNFLQHLSGIATTTRQYVEAIKHTNATLLDTRKTTPGLRFAEKYATKCGGAQNHRMGLYDAIMIKDNHAALAGRSFTEIVEMVAAQQEAGVKVIVECDTLAQFEIANTAGIQHILLDNMTNDQLCSAVKNKNDGVKLEASGNVHLETIATIAETGVDYISTSKITQGALPIDIGLDFM